MDLRSAHTVEYAQSLVLTSSAAQVTWQASDTGLSRYIARPDRAPFEQRILEEPTAFSIRDRSVLVLTLIDQDLWRLFALPVGVER